MILKYTTVKNQGWFDLAIQLYGNADKAYELATFNNYSILVNPQPLTEIEYEIDTFNNPQNGFNNSNNSIVSTLPNTFLTVNSFSDDFNLNEYF